MINFYIKIHNIIQKPAPVDRQFCQTGARGHADGEHEDA